LITKMWNCWEGLSQIRVKSCRGE